MTLYDQSIAVYRTRIDTLVAILAKAAAHEKGDALLDCALAPDMFALGKQVRMLANFPGDAIARLTERSYVGSEDPVTSFAEAKTVLAETAALLDSIEAGELCSADAPVVLSLPNGMEFTMTAEQYVRDWSLPNFYFHLTTAYAILRAQGLELGKIDFLPHMMPYLTKGPAQA